MFIVMSTSVGSGTQQVKQAGDSCEVNFLPVYRPTLLPQQENILIPPEKQEWNSTISVIQFSRQVLDSYFTLSCSDASVYLQEAMVAFMYTLQSITFQYSLKLQDVLQIHCDFW